MIDGIEIAIIVARASNGVIGREGDMPWRLSTDLKRFKALTMGKPLVMGRKTLESFPKLLPGRPHIVVTRNTEYCREGVTVTASLDAALQEAVRQAAELGVGEVFVVGGGEIYRQALPLADRLYVTHIDAAPEGDTTFPSVSDDAWTVVEELAVPAGERDDHSTVYTVYRRRG